MNIQKLVDLTLEDLKQTIYVLIEDAFSDNRWTVKDASLLLFFRLKVYNTSSN